MRCCAGWLGLALLLAGTAVANSNPLQAPEEASPRDVLPLVDGWRFRFGPTGEAPAAPDLDDGDWERVSIPHSWNRVGEYSLTRSEKTDVRRGAGWYRLHVVAPGAAPGRRFYLDFAAVATIADVWVNGAHVGAHKGAFARFRFDVTAEWKPGEANLIAVRADNSAPVIGGVAENVIPLSGDFFVHGGIYRGVSLIARDEAGVDLEDHGGPGVYARTTSLKADRAFVDVLTRLRNAGARTRRLDLVTVIRDADGRRVAEASRALELRPGAAETRASLEIAAPRLWDGRRDPHLYSITVEARDGGRAIDRVTQPLGLRTFRFDADDGFFLNGKPLKLRGASRHQDRLGKGWALSRADHAEDMAFFVEIGANAVRQAHYQHADEWSDEADRNGMAVWAELPYVNMSSLSGGEGAPALWDNAAGQLRELIRQAYNHPSVLMWSVGNEVDSVAERPPSGEPRKSRPLLAHLAEIAKREDHGRPTIFADCCESRPGGEALVGATDLVGYNRYHGWYYTQPIEAGSALGSELDRLHARHPKTPISVAEYGAGGALSDHSDDVRVAAPDAAGRPQPEDFQSFIHEQSWPAIRERRFVFGSFIWNMFDFGVDARNEGDSVGLNTKGLVTADRSIRKDAFYYYKAQWTSEPMIHLTGKRHVERAYPAMEIKAYSNAEKATLTLNGRMIGEAPCVDRICRWPDVRLDPGANTAVASAETSGSRVSDHAQWVGPDERDGVRIDAGDIADRVVGGRRFGSDSFVTGGTVAGLKDAGRGGAPAPRIDAPEPDLYVRWREGERFAYAIPMRGDCHMVTVHMFEPPGGAAAISASPDGRIDAPPVDLAQAGGMLKGVARRFPVRSQGGVLTLEFSAGPGGSKTAVAAIEIAGRC